MIKKVVFVIIVSLLLLLYFISEVNKKKEHNWSFNFSSISKDPYGCFVLKSGLEKSKNPGIHHTSHETFYASLQKPGNGKMSYLVITDNFSPDTLNLSSVYNFVHEGNNFFVSAYSFSKFFKDSLKFDIKEFETAYIGMKAETLNFVHPALKLTIPATFQGMTTSVFSKIDSANHRVEGTNRNGRANFISVPYGNGRFYLHCQPLVFSNYHILYSHSEYAYNALSYLTNTNLVWDDYYKPEKARYTVVSRSPLRYFLSHEAMRMAIYLTLILIAIYFLIESKRKQRYIPVVKPPENSTVRFVSTIARLHQGHPNYREMALKKYLYLKDSIYSRHLLRLDENNPETAIQFSEKTGFSLDKMKEFFVMVRRIDSSISVTSETLIDFSRMVDEIYEFEKDK